jgi:hypothetical protein
VQFRQLDVRPGRGLAPASGRRGREAHRLDGPDAVADQLPRVRDARVGRQARLEGRQPVEDRKGLVVTAELEQRVTDQGERSCRARGKLLCAASKPEPAMEIVARERERREPLDGDPVLRVERECTPEDALRLRQVRRVRGLPCALLVRQSERCERRSVAPSDGRIGKRRRLAPEHAAEEEDGGGECRHRPCRQEAPLRHPQWCEWS